MTRLVSVFFIVLVLAQILISPVIHQSRMTALAGTLDSDVEMICTGKDMRFISVSATERSGQFVFINVQPKQQEQANNLCPEHLGIEQTSFITATFASKLCVRIAHEIFSLRLDSILYQSSKYLHAILRAPPAL